MTALRALIMVVAIAAVMPTSASAQTAGTKNNKQAKRTLEDIRIEGEIAVPQVLFITSRDYRRYRDNLGLTFRKNSLDVARSAYLPNRLRFVVNNTEEKTQ
jgi:hypothetical protein